MHQNIRSRYRGINVPRGERIASVVIGGALAAAAMNKRSVLLGVLGAALIVRGATGRSALYRLRATRKGISVHRSVTIQASPLEIYRLWRDFTNLPRFMEHVTEVEVDADGISTWHVRERGVTLGWRAEITEDTPGRRLRWRSLPGGDIVHEGTLDLYEAPGGRGTVVEVRIVYRSPAAFALRTLPQIELAEDLARLRMLLETGELATGASHEPAREVSL
jgi:uncharacterized membrane protein